MTVILASTSAIRRQLLTNAGVAFEAVAPRIDEDVLKASHAGSSPSQLATALAEAKAMSVSSTMTEGLVIGADQVLNLDGAGFGKPKDTQSARDQLRRLRGRAHRLDTAICCAEAGRVVWRHLARPELRMRTFSDDFLERYLHDVGAATQASVGAYQLESLGAQLFEAIEGDYFAILGLPLLPLLGFLRSRGAIAT